MPYPTPDNSFETLIKILREIYQQQNDNVDTISNKQNDLTLPVSDLSVFSSLILMDDTGDIPITPTIQDEVYLTSPGNMVSLATLIYNKSFTIPQLFLPFLEFETVYIPPPNIQISAGVLINGVTVNTQSSTTTTYITPPTTPGAVPTISSLPPGNDLYFDGVYYWQYVVYADNGAWFNDGVEWTAVTGTPNMFDYVSNIAIARFSGGSPTGNPGEYIIEVTFSPDSPYSDLTSLNAGVGYVGGNETIFPTTVPISKYYCKNNSDPIFIKMSKSTDTKEIWNVNINNYAQVISSGILYNYYTGFNYTLSVPTPPLILDSIYFNPEDPTAFVIQNWIDEVTSYLTLYKPSTPDILGRVKTYLRPMLNYLTLNKYNTQVS